MSWFEKAKTALIEALDIQDDTNTKSESTAAIVTTSTSSTTTTSTTPNSEMEKYASTSPTQNTHNVAFFDNPNANEMITVAPRANDVNQVTSGQKLMTKRQSATSDSIDLLSTPTSPSETGAAINNSESISLELITATATTASEIETSPEDTEPSLPDSIVIIASNETSDNADDAEIDDDNDKQTQLNDSTKTLKPLTFPEVQNEATCQTTADSDSTHSFEDIQMHMSHKSQKTNDSAGPTRADAGGDQSYSSTSSDIEIISNPNGDSASTTNSGTTRVSPQKLKDFAFNSSSKCKDSSALHTNSGNGNSGIPQTNNKPRGHYREPSEISLLSEDSQSELDKLVNRISELNQLIEAREQRLLQSERQNAELLERNQSLQAAVDAVQSSSTGSDAADAVQRLSALEKKFQSSIRERDALRIQMKQLKDELQNKIPKDQLAESNEMIAALQTEGEKLSKEILQQSNIIKKLRVKEKTTDTLLKKNAEQISLLSSETERLKRTLIAKEEVERSQIEAVHKMTSEKRRVDDENAEYRSRNEDLQSKLSALQASFDGVKTDLQQRSRQEQDQMKAENQEFVQQMADMREKLRITEHAMAKREQQMREENRDLQRRLEAAELRAETVTVEVSQTTTPLIRQIESLQKTLTQRQTNWQKDEESLLQKLNETQTQLKSMHNLNSAHNEKYDLLRTRCNQLEEQLSHALMQTENSKIELRQLALDDSLKEAELKREISNLEQNLQTCKTKIEMLEQHNKNLEAQKNATIKTELTLAALKAVEMNAAATSFDAQQQTHDSQHQHHQQQPQQVSPTTSFAGTNCSNDEVSQSGGILDWQTDDLDCISMSGRQPHGYVHGVHLNFLSHNTTTLEHLQSLLKQRDGELTHLQWELSRLQAERGVLNEEISNLTLELENFKDKFVTYESMEKNYDDLQHRYDALLQMYGEKVERTEELELDLVELKTAYKIQIDELLAQPPTSNAQTQRRT